jgi:hypothetical protein
MNKELARARASVEGNRELLAAANVSNSGGRASLPVAIFINSGMSAAMRFSLHVVFIVVSFRWLMVGSFHSACFSDGAVYGGERTGRLWSFEPTAGLFAVEQHGYCVAKRMQRAAFVGSYQERTVEQ